jgi:hypothetical protein
MHPNLKFTSESGNNNISYLDISIFRTEAKFALEEAMKTQTRTILSYSFFNLGARRE